MAMAIRGSRKQGFTLIRDLIKDIRFSRRSIQAGLNVEEETQYVKQCEEMLQKLWPVRHAPLLTTAGWPVVWLDEEAREAYKDCG